MTIAHLYYRPDYIIPMTDKRQNEPQYHFAQKFLSEGYKMQEYTWDGIHSCIRLSNETSEGTI